MATLTIKNLPDDLYQALKQKAASHHRSLNNEAIVSLVQAVQQYETSPQDILQQARRVRIQNNRCIILTNDMIDDMKRQGRS